jgi:hypothetical protein
MSATTGRIQGAAEKIRGHLRFAATAFAVATPLMYDILIWQRLNGGLQNRRPGVIATLPLLIAGMILGSIGLLLARIYRWQEPETIESQISRAERGGQSTSP